MKIKILKKKKLFKRLIMYYAKDFPYNYNIYLLNVNRLFATKFFVLKQNWIFIFYNNLSLSKN